MVGVQTAGVISFMGSPERFVRELNAMNTSCTVSRFNLMPDTEAGPLTARTDLAESKARGKGTIG